MADSDSELTLDVAFGIVLGLAMIVAAAAWWVCR